MSPQAQLAQGANPAVVVPDAYVIARGGTKAIPAVGTQYSADVGFTIVAAARNIPHGKIRTTTAGAVRRAGGTVTLEPAAVPRGKAPNPQHAHVTEGGRASGSSKRIRTSERQVAMLGWAKIEDHQGYYDFARMFLIRRRRGWRRDWLLFECKWDEELEDFETVFHVYLLPPMLRTEIPDDLSDLSLRAVRCLGTVDERRLRFDSTRKKWVKLDVLKELKPPASTGGE